MITHEHHGHDHGAGAGPHTHLTSVGIDIGSSTSNLVFSELRIGYPSPYQRTPRVLERELIARSQILLTPFSDDWNIRTEELRVLIDGAFESAGLTRNQIDTGAVIVTGEAARRENAVKVTELFADESGKFVCATAGPKLETIMAAHGSGAVAKSRTDDVTLLNVDLGGATTKVSVISSGRIIDTTAINIGARLIAWDSAGTVTRLEKPGRRWLDDLGVKLELGEKIADQLSPRLGARMAQALFDALDGEGPKWPGFYVTAALSMPVRCDALLFSGGVSEYIYEREKRTYGDMGPDFAREVKGEAVRRGYAVIESCEGIRATVIGASQYTVQLSGETIFLPAGTKLPLRNLRVCPVRVDWETPVAERAAAAILDMMRTRDAETCGFPFVLSFSSPPFVGYGAARELAQGIGHALDKLPTAERPEALLFEQNVGRVIGNALSTRWQLPCIDEITVCELDFVDLGDIVPGQGFMPVVVKSLAFGA